VWAISPSEPFLSVIGNDSHGISRLNPGRGPVRHEGDQ
jgi:hypothetical protein